MTAGYSWDRMRYNSPAGAPPASTYYESASPRTAPAGTVVVTPPASGVVVAPAPAPGVVVTPAPGVVVTPGVVVPNTPLICPNVNPADPRKC